MAEEGGDGFQAHAPVDGLGGQGVAELVGVDVADARPLGHRVDVAVDGAPVEGLAVVALDQSTRAARAAGAPIVADEVDQHGVKRHVAVVVQFADRDAQPEGLAIWTMASSSRAASSPTRMPVRASSSTMSRRRGLGSSATAAMNLAMVGSSRNLGSGSSALGSPR